MSKRIVLELVCDTPECEAEGYYSGTTNMDVLTAEATRAGWTLSVGGDFCPWCNKYKTTSNNV